MSQIADGAMSQVNDILIRMKTLSVQSASDQLSDTERGMLDTELQALLSENDRITADTEFNGNQLVNGSASVETVLNSLTDDDLNLMQAADGFHSIEFTPAVGSSAFDVDYDLSTGVMTVQNLTSGESQGLSVDKIYPIATKDTQAIVFDNIGTPITLNSAFDKTESLSASGGTAVTTNFDGGTSTRTASSAIITDNTIAVTNNTCSGTGGSVITITATSADNATLTRAGGFSASGIDVSSTGL
jgi:flagellin